MNDMTPPTPHQPTDKLTATLEAQEWNVIFAGLNELPRRISDPVFVKLMGQVARGSNRAAVENNVSH
jgi:hypothetical protein